MGILKYIFSTAILLGIVAPSFSQDERRHGVRLGVDLSRFALPYVDGGGGRTGMEFSIDVDATRNLHITAELGNQTVEQVDNSALSYNYLSHGNYGRLGVDYNFLKNQSENQYEMVFGGARIGYAKMHHSAYAINITPNYWTKEYSTSAPESRVNTVWLELVGGIKAELFKNFFIGWSVRGRLRFSQTTDAGDYLNIDPLYVPGYGKGEKKVNMGMTYSIFYRIPLMKYKPKPVIQ